MKSERGLDARIMRKIMNQTFVFMASSLASHTYTKVHEATTYNIRHANNSKHTKQDL